MEERQGKTEAEEGKEKNRSSMYILLLSDYCRINIYVRIYVYTDRPTLITTMKYKYDLRARVCVCVLHARISQRILSRDAFPK